MEFDNEIQQHLEQEIKAVMKIPIESNNLQGTTDIKIEHIHKRGDILITLGKDIKDKRHMFYNGNGLHQDLDTLN